MIEYSTFGTNDYEETKRYYDALFAEIGYSRRLSDHRMTVWGEEDRSKSGISFLEPTDQKEATIGNSFHLTTMVDDQAALERLANKTLELGGKVITQPVNGESPSPLCVQSPEGHQLSFITKGTTSVRAGFTSLAVPSIEKSRAFYDTIFGALEFGVISEAPRKIVWGNHSTRDKIAIVTHMEDAPIITGNGNMISLYAKSADGVDRLYQMALDLGGQCSGAPYSRGSMYWGWIRSPEGHRFAFFASDR